MFLHRIQQMFHNYLTPFLISNTESLLSLTRATRVSTGKWYSKSMLTGSGSGIGSGSGSGSGIRSIGSGSGGSSGGSSGGGGGGGDHFIWLVILTSGVLAWRIRKGPSG
jgi:hypothetical protein